MRHACYHLAVFCLLCTMCALPAHSQTARPKIRSIAAFVRIGRDHSLTQLRDALALLRDAQRAFQQAGYEVETIRITTQPFSELVAGASDAQLGAFFHTLNAWAKQERVILNIGPAMVADTDPPEAAELLARTLAENDQLYGSIIVAQDEGVHWKAIRAAARVMKYLAEHGPKSQGNFQFAVTAMLGAYSPFFPGSHHTGAGHEFSLGFQSANVVQAVLAAHPGDLAAAEQSLTAELARYYLDCERIASDVAKRSGWTYAGLDPTPAPEGEASIGGAIEKFTGAPFGSSGTLTAAAMITRAVKAVPVKQVGYAGLMVAVLEDNVLAQRWSENAFTIDSLLAYSAICGTGLDTVPLPGAITADQLARILGDVATLAFKWKKPLSARLLPVAGKKPGDKTDFDNPHLTNAVLQKLP